MTTHNLQLSFKPKQVTKNLLSSLPDRAKEVMTKRYGLAAKSERLTLEAIGANYSITRERVRQIENSAIFNIRKSKEFKEEKSSFDALEKLLHEMGGIIKEDDFLNHISKDPIIQNHINFMLVVSETFKREKEDDEFEHRWYIDPELSKRVHEALRKLYKNLNDDDLVPESEMIAQFLNHCKDVSEKYKNDEIMKRWLRISKKIDKNPLGEWGVSHSPNIRAKGIRDYAFLAMRKHGSPIHFKDIAQIITDLFEKKAHPATTHNELIKDPRFVLVGRGLYALSEWGYLSGVVKDVIKKVLQKNGPLNKEDIIEKVMKERYVKENTILVNLYNSKYFKKMKDGKYSLV